LTKILSKVSDKWKKKTKIFTGCEKEKFKRKLGACIVKARERQERWGDEDLDCEGSDIEGGKV